LPAPETALVSRAVKKKPRTAPERRKTPRRNTFLPRAIGVTGGVALAGAAFLFFKHQADRVMEGAADEFDLAVMDVVHEIDNPSMHRAMHAVTQLGTHAAIGAAAGITALAMLRKHRKADARTVLISTGGAMVIMHVLKNVFQRKRPQDLTRRIKLPKSHSFPSGHALLSAATYPIVAHHLVQSESVAVQGLVHSMTMATILAVGFSRVYFGVHFPSDVLGGFAVGFGWLGLTSLTHTLADNPCAHRRKPIVE
jgi:membrane-associated phospholipid phosphatase